MRATVKDALYPPVQGIEDDGVERPLPQLDVDVELLVLADELFREAVENSDLKGYTGLYPGADAEAAFQRVIQGEEFPDIPAGQHTMATSQRERAYREMKEVFTSHPRWPEIRRAAWIVMALRGSGAIWAWGQKYFEGRFPDLPPYRGEYSSLLEPQGHYIGIKFPDEFRRLASRAFKKMAMEADGRGRASSWRAWEVKMVDRPMLVPSGLPGYYGGELAPTEIEKRLLAR